MAPVQQTFSIIPELPSYLGGANGADGEPPGRPSRPPMTTKQAKKAYKAANKGPKLSKAEQRRQDLMEQDRIRREFEKERNQARARARIEKKKEKEDKVRTEKKKKGLPLVDVRPSQDTLARFMRPPRPAPETKGPAPDEVRQRPTEAIIEEEEEEEEDEEEKEDDDREGEHGHSEQTRGSARLSSDDRDEPPRKRQRIWASQNGTETPANDTPATTQTLAMPEMVMNREDCEDQKSRADEIIPEKGKPEPPLGIIEQNVSLQRALPSRNPPNGRCDSPKRSPGSKKRDSAVTEHSIPPKVNQPTLNESFGADDDLFDCLDTATVIKPLNTVPVTAKTLLEEPESMQHRAVPQPSQRELIEKTKHVSPGSLPRISVTTEAAQPTKSSKAESPMVHHRLGASRGSGSTENIRARGSEDRARPSTRATISTPTPGPHRSAVQAERTSRLESEAAVPKNPSKVQGQRKSIQSRQDARPPRAPLQDIPPNKVSTLNTSSHSSHKPEPSVPVRSSKTGSAYAQRAVRPASGHGSFRPPPKTPMGPPQVPPKFKTPHQPETRSGPSSKPKFLPQNRASQVKTTSHTLGPSRDTVPSSTQAFLASNFDDLFPSPSQEVRELLEVARPASISSRFTKPAPRHRLASSTASSVPLPARNSSGLPASRGSTNSRTTQATRTGATGSVKAPSTNHTTMPPIEMPFLSTQDLFLSSQDLMDIEDQTSSPIKGPRTKARSVACENHRLTSSSGRKPAPSALSRLVPGQQSAALGSGLAILDSAAKAATATQLGQAKQEASEPKTATPVAAQFHAADLSGNESAPHQLLSHSPPSHSSQRELLRPQETPLVVVASEVRSRVEQPRAPRPSPKPFFTSSMRERKLYLLERSKTAAWEGVDAQLKAQRELDGFEDERYARHLQDNPTQPEDVRGDVNIREPGQPASEEKPTSGSAASLGQGDGHGRGRERASQRMAREGRSSASDGSRGKATMGQKRPRSSYEEMCAFLDRKASEREQMAAANSITTTTTITVDKTSQESEYGDGGLQDDDLLRIT